MSTAATTHPGFNNVASEAIHVDIVIEELLTILGSGAVVEFVPLQSHYCGYAQCGRPRFFLHDSGLPSPLGYRPVSAL
jgi:hypothetical protein